MVRTLLVTALLVVVFNQVGLALLNRYTTNFGYWLVNKQWAALDKGVGKPSWLILGDSTAVTGVVPEVFGAELHGRVRNFATFADLLAVNDAWMLSEYIRQHGAPKHVVVVHTVDHWHRAYKSVVLAKVPRPWGFWETFNPPIELDWPKLWNIFKGKYFALYAEKKSVASILRHPGLVADRWFKMSPSGHVPGRPHDPFRVARDLGRTYHLVRSERFRMSMINRAALEAFCAMTDAEGFDLYLAFGPMHDALEHDPTFQRYRDAEVADLRRRTAACKHVHVVPDQFYFPGSALDVHVDHVTPAVAPDYTRKLARAVIRVRQKARKGRPQNKAKPSSPLRLH